MVRARAGLSGMLPRLPSFVSALMSRRGAAPTDLPTINGANRGFRLRRMRQEAGLRQQRVALAPPHPPPLEPEHPDRSRYRVRHAQAPERLHLLHQGRKGLPLTPAVPRSRGSWTGDFVSLLVFVSLSAL